MAVGDRPAGDLEGRRRGLAPLAGRGCPGPGPARPPGRPAIANRRRRSRGRPPAGPGRLDQVARDDQPGDRDPAEQASRAWPGSRPASARAGSRRRRPGPTRSRGGRRRSPPAARPGGPPRPSGASCQPSGPSIIAAHQPFVEPLRRASAGRLEPQRLRPARVDPGRRERRRAVQRRGTGPSGRARQPGQRRRGVEQVFEDLAAGLAEQGWSGQAALTSG